MARFRVPAADVSELVKRIRETAKISHVQVDWFDEQTCLIIVPCVGEKETNMTEAELISWLYLEGKKT